MRVESLTFQYYINKTVYDCGSYISVRNRSALSAHDSSDLAALWPGVEVVTGALEGDSLHVSLNTNLKIINHNKTHLLWEKQFNYSH